MKLVTKFLIGALFLMPGLAVYAQQTTGEITGTVTDASGAVVPGATITATDTATQQVRATTTNSTGGYTIPYLTPGVYNIKSEKAGFKTDQNTNATLEVGAIMRMDFKMQVGQVNEQVEVTTAAPLLSTESTAVENNVQAQAIVSLPLNGRDYLQLVALNPNVVMEVGNTAAGVGLGGARAADLISVAGQRTEYNHYTLDGVENTEPNYNTYIVHPSVDALQEFTVLTGIYSAEFGRGASQVNANTLPGGNAYHGTAYDFLRNDFVDARIWQQTGAKNNFHRQDYGFVLDGPISIPKVLNGKDKLFFTSYFEDQNDHEFDQVITSVPTVDMINGNFNDHMPSENTIYWPGTQVWSGTKGACPVYSGDSATDATRPYAIVAGLDNCNRSGTPNVIPPSMISAKATQLMTGPNTTGSLTPGSSSGLGLIPLPNWNNVSKTPDSATEEDSFSNNYRSEVPNLIQSTQFGTRVDWTMNARSTLFGRFSWEDDLGVPAAAFGAINQDVANSTAKQIVVGHTFQINQHMVNEFRTGWSYFYNDDASPFSNGSFNPQAAVGITGLVAHGAADYGYPGINNGVSNFGGAAPYVTHDDIYSISDSITIIKGKHTMSVGGSVEDDEFNELGNQFGTGAMTESGTATLNPGLGSSSGSTAGGLGLATFELGLIDGEYLRISALSNTEMRAKKYAAFFQDDYKLRPNVTLNLGVRYDNIRPWVDKHDNFWNADVFGTGVTNIDQGRYTEPLSQIVGGAEGVGSAAGTNSSTPIPVLTRPGAQGCNFYGTASNPATLQFGEPGQPVQCGDNFMGRATVDPNNKNFGPRAGIDYTLGTKTSIRAGFGIYFVTDQNEAAFDMGRNLGGKDGAAAGTQNVYVPLASPWSAEVGSSACGPNAFNGNVAWTGVCELPGTAVAVGGETAGTSGPQIQAIAQHNRTPYVEQYILNIQRQLSKNVALEVAYTGNESHHDLKDFIYNAPIPRTGPTDTSNIPQRRPWESLGNIQATRDFASGNYNALDVKLSQHPSQGLSYTVAFTWGHSLDYGSAYRPNAGDNLWPSNSYWYREEYGGSQFNQPTRLVGSLNYELPFGHGKMFAPTNGIVNHIVSGWQFGSIVTFGHGLSINANNAGDPSSLGGQNTMPEYVNSGPYKNPSPGITISSPYWNPAAFACAYTAKPTTVPANPALNCATPGYPNQAWQAGNWRRENLYAPGLEDWDANLGRTFHIHESQTLLFRMEAFNATNHVNWATPSTTNPSSATFGVINTTSQKMRQLQGAIKYSF